MTDSRQQVISASRRTDIPAWYTPWFLDRIRQGGFEVKNPFNGQVRQVRTAPDNTHSIVFWSKNYGPFLDLGADRILSESGFHLYFNFTLNSPDPILEPGLPGLGSRVDQARQLTARFGPGAVAWRFDPICRYTDLENLRKNNLTDFKRIADAMAGMGILKCVTSFYDHYKKVDRRIRHLENSGKPVVRLLDFDKARMHRIIRKMAAYLDTNGMTLNLCCEAGVFNTLEQDGIAVRENACVDGRLLKELYGGNPVLARDFGQRAKQGCRCTKSVDIGSYSDHPCGHNCLFCYANTALDEQLRQENA